MKWLFLSSFFCLTFCVSEPNAWAGQIPLDPFVHQLEKEGFVFQKISPLTLGGYLLQCSNPSLLYHPVVIELKNEWYAGLGEYEWKGQREENLEDNLPPLHHLIRLGTKVTVTFRAYEFLESRFHAWRGRPWPANYNDYAAALYGDFWHELIHAQQAEGPLGKEIFTLRSSKVRPDSRQLHAHNLYQEGEASTANFRDGQYHRRNWNTLVNALRSGDQARAEEAVAQIQTTLNFKYLSTGKISRTLRARQDCVRLLAGVAQELQTR